MMDWYSYEAEYRGTGCHHDAALIHAGRSHAAKNLTFRIRLSSMLRAWANRLDPQLPVLEVPELTSTVTDSNAI